jgi:hypothetical protein
MSDPEMDYAIQTVLGPLYSSVGDEYLYFSALEKLGMTHRQWQAMLADWLAR